MYNYKYLKYPVLFKRTITRETFLRDKKIL